MLGKPIYTQAEAEFMLSQPKIVPPNAYREHRIAGRPGNYDLIIAAKSETEPAVDYQIEIRRIPNEGEFSFQISAKLEGRQFESIARYDIHESDHQDPDWCGGNWVEAGTCHVHRYNEATAKREDRWDSIALSIDATEDESLYHLFLDGMRITFLSQDDFSSCKLWVNP